MPRGYKNDPVSLLLAAQAIKNILCYARCSIVPKLSNKQSAKAICRFGRLRTAHSKTQKAIVSNGNLLAAHAFDYIVLRINPGLTSCKDLATVVDNNLDSN